MQQTGIFAGRTEVRCPYARWGWTRGGGKVWHGGLDLAGLDDATIRMPYYKGKRITGRVTRARIVTDRRDKTWEWGYYVCVQLDRGQTPSAMACSASSTTGYSSYSTRMSSRARRAVISSSATTAAMSSP